MSKRINSKQSFTSNPQSAKPKTAPKSAKPQVQTQKSPTEKPSTTTQSTYKQACSKKEQAMKKLSGKINSPKTNGARKGYSTKISTKKSVKPLLNRGRVVDAVCVSAKKIADKNPRNIPARMVDAVCTARQASTGVQQTKKKSGLADKAVTTLNVARAGHGIALVGGKAIKNHRIRKQVVKGMQATIKDQAARAGKSAFRKAKKTVSKEQAKQIADTAKKAANRQLQKQVRQHSKTIVKEGQKLLQKSGGTYAEKALTKSLKTSVKHQVKEKVLQNAGKALSRTTRLGRFLVRGVPYANGVGVAVDANEYRKIASAHIEGKASTAKLLAASVTAGISALSLKVPLLGWVSGLTGIVRDAL